jgi:hypothetical protein
MTEPDRTPKRGGADSPAGESAAGTAQEHEDTVRKGYDAAQEPEPQADGDPGPDPVESDPPAAEERAQGG